MSRFPNKRLRDDDGFQLVEVAVALMVLGVSVLGLAGAMNLGITIAGQARQRSAAAAVAAERIEIVRNLPYEEVALDVQPTHETDPDNPDHWVTTDSPPRYDVKQGGGALEDLVVDGSVLHIEDPVVSGPTELFVYQYVTWVDDPTLDPFKRVTVVVTWRSPLNPSVSHTVTSSTFVGSGQVTVPESTPEPLSGEPGPEGGGSGNLDPCDSVNAPAGTISILSGSGATEGFTNSTTIQVRIEPTSEECTNLRSELSNDNVNYTEVAIVSRQEGDCGDQLCAWQPVTVTWTILDGEGDKKVRGRLEDGSGKLSAVDEKTIVLDQTPPTVPTSLSPSTCEVSGEDRTVTFSWGASTDTHLLGYRLYRSINSEPWTVVATVSGTTASDTTKKTHDSVRYLVRAYDKAGNESGDSNALTYHKNSC